jgi:D-Tyr-tRNAtyr deacylase
MNGVTQDQMKKAILAYLHKINELRVMSAEEERMPDDVFNAKVFEEAVEAAVFAFQNPA